MTLFVKKQSFVTLTVMHLKLKSMGQDNPGEITGEMSSL